MAAAAGVSTATVSHVLNRPELVSTRARARVEEVIEELGFVRNASARQLSDGHSRAIGLVVLDASPFNTEMTRGVEDAVKKDGYVVIVCNSASSADREQQNLRLLEEQRVGGVLITPVAHAKLPVLDRLRASGTPVVFLDHRGGLRVCSVSVDDVAGGRLAAEHLLALGHRRIALIGGRASVQPDAERRQGFLETLSSAGVELGPEADITTEMLHVEDGEAAATRLLELPEPPTAVFCANDLLAIGALRAALTHGCVVPNELAIVGYDDVVFAELATVPLTSVRQPIYDLGYSAARLLLDEVTNSSHHHKRHIFEPELIVRESTIGRTIPHALAAPITADTVNIPSNNRPRGKPTR